MKAAGKLRPLFKTVPKVPLPAGDLNPLFAGGC